MVTAEDFAYAGDKLSALLPGQEVVAGLWDYFGRLYALSSINIGIIILLLVSWYLVKHYIVPIIPLVPRQLDTVVAIVIVIAGYAVLATLFSFALNMACGFGVCL